MGAMPIGFSVSPGHMASSVREVGYVLPTVLWVLAVLALVSMALLESTRLDVRTQANLQTARQVQLVADGITRYVASALAQGSAATRALFDTASGEVVACQAGDLRINLRVTDVSGLIDLNAAPLQDLAVLIAGSGVRTEQARSLAAAIVDFRDADAVAIAGGDEGDAYISGSLPFGPKNAPFETIGELDQLPGMSAEVLNRLDGLVTVHSRRPFFDELKAPQELIAAMGRRRIDADRRNGPTRSRIQDIRIEVDGARKARATRHAIAELRPDLATGLIFREWRSPPNVLRSGAGGNPKTCAAIANLVAR